MLHARAWFLALLVLAAAASRVLPHPPNFAPMTALALFGAATFRERWAAWLAPVGALLFSDTLLHFTHQWGWQPSWGFYRGQWVVYTCLLATTGLGFALRGRRTAANVAAATLAGSVLFFGATNFAVWALGSGSTYPKTAGGLLLCYEMAVPFFRNGLLGDSCYALILFGSLALAEARVPALRPRPSLDPASLPAAA